MRLVLAAYTGMEWDGIERRRSASAIGSLWVYKFVKKQAQPFK
jgi:hypothetical protein